MQKEEILKVLDEWNYWSKPSRGSFPRKGYEDEVAHKASVGEILFVKGVRRSGKYSIKRRNKEIVFGGLDKGGGILWINGYNVLKIAS